MTGEPIRVLIRADASVQMGTGHVMRCLTLGKELQRRGAEVRFLSRQLPGHLCEFVERQGFDVYKLPWQENDQEPWLGVTWQRDAEQVLDVLQSEPQGFDWLLIDHYGLDARWEQRLRPHVKRIMVIDDLADRMHDCDLLLDQNLHGRPEERYKGLVPSESDMLLGPSYALLRQEFRMAFESVKPRAQGIRRVLVFFGGTDPTEETEKTLHALQSLPPNELLFDVIVGSTNPKREHIRQLVEQMPNASFHCQVSDMAAKMIAADLAIGAGGSTTWERCCLGLPTLQIVVADNQREIAYHLAEAGAGVLLGESTEVTFQQIQDAMESLMAAPEQVEQMSKRALTLVDGRGAERVGEKMMTACGRGEHA